MALDFSSLQGLQGQANQASSEASTLAANSPGLLQQLQSNLTGIFAKDNPLIEARGQALADFLSTPARARAEFLPTNMAQVEGSGLNLSPTQQNAVTTSHQSAALAPLAGLNQIITGIYGNVPQIVQNAGNIYQSQIQAAQLRAQQLQQQYENAFSQLLEQEKSRQFDTEQARLSRGSGSGTGLDLSSILGLMGGGQQQLPQEGLAIQSARDRLAAQFDQRVPAPTGSRAPLSQQVQALPSSGLSFGLPKSFGEFGQRLGAWKDLLIGGLTGR